MISVLILTKNEERDLAGALASVAWSDDVHVFDSCSTDATVEIARAAGAQVHSRAFDDYATHRNAALGIAFKYPWVFLLDADERPTRSCAQRCSAWWARLRRTLRAFACAVATSSSARG